MNEARNRIHLSDAELEERFLRFGYRVSISDIAFTTEAVDDFRQARLTWVHAGHLATDEPGLLVIEGAQPRHGQPTRDMVILGLGASRAVMGVNVQPGALPLPSGSLLLRYAPTMQWAPKVAEKPREVAKTPAKRSFW